jgi:hypothetical protein
MQAAQKVERFIKERRQTDEKLVGWVLYVFLLSWITFGVYPIIVFWKRIARADNFRERKRNYYESVIEYTKQYAEETGKFDAMYNEVNDLDGAVKDTFTDKIKPINPGLSLVLTIVTVGIWGLYVLYRLDKFWWEIQEFEQDFDDSVSQMWAKLGIVRYPISFTPRQSVKRSFGLYLGLSVLTVGVWSLVWDYKVHTDPDSLYPEFHSAEDAVLNAVRNAPVPAMN